MSIVMHALAGLFSVIFIIGIGYVLAKRGWFDDDSSKLLARLVTSVALPLCGFFRPRVSILQKVRHFKKQGTTH